MGQDKIINFIMRLLLVQAFLVIAINAQYIRSSTNKPLQPGTGSKLTKLKTVIDDNSPRSIKAVINENGKPIIQLTWVKTNQLVTSKNLPVWGAQCNDIHESKVNETEEILDSFVMYQDISHNSAIVYVKGKELIYGHVGVNYYIYQLPVKHPEKKLVIEVTGPYFKKNTDIKNVESLESDSGKRNGNQSLTKRNNYYLETLLFVAYDIVAQVKAKHPDDYTYYILLDYAIYFNAIDMMFAKLPASFRININLAGIIFEEDEDAFSSILDSETLENSDDDVELNEFDKIFMRYFQSNFDFVFEENSFDYVFLSTSRGLKYKNKSFVGLSFVPMDINEARRGQDPDILHTPLSILKRSNPHSGFIDAAHEIAHVLGHQSHNPEPKGILESDSKCSDLQQASDDNFNDCFTWDKEIVTDIEAYMRKHKNRCLNLNFPLSLYNNNELKVYEVPAQQCKCFGYAGYIEEQGKVKRYVPDDGCGKPLECVKQSNKSYIDESIVLPLNGTPCSKDFKKVCWKQQCVAISKN